MILFYITIVSVYIIHATMHAWLLLKQYGTAITFLVFISFALYCAQNSKGKVSSCNYSHHDLSMQKASNSKAMAKVYLSLCSCAFVLSSCFSKHHRNRSTSIVWDDIQYVIYVRTKAEAVGSYFSYERINSSSTVVVQKVYGSEKRFNDSFCESKLM